MTNCVIFSLENSTFGIPIQQVGRIGKWESIENLPDSPEWISGIVTYRDKIYPYIRLWEILDLNAPEKEYILLPHKKDVCAFGISKIEGIHEIERKDKDKRVIPAKYISGFGKLEERVVIVIDIYNFLDEEQEVVLENLRVNKSSGNNGD